MAGKEIGLSSIELLTADDFATIKKHGLSCAMVQVKPAKGPDGQAICICPQDLLNGRTPRLSASRSS